MTVRLVVRVDRQVRWGASIAASICWNIFARIFFPSFFVLVFFLKKKNKEREREREKGTRRETCRNHLVCILLGNLAPKRFSGHFRPVDCPYKMVSARLIAILQPPPPPPPHSKGKKRKRKRKIKEKKSKNILPSSSSHFFLFEESKTRRGRCWRGGGGGGIGEGIGDGRNKRSRIRISATDSACRLFLISSRIATLIIGTKNRGGCREVPSPSHPMALPFSCIHLSSWISVKNPGRIRMASLSLRFGHRESVGTSNQKIIPPVCLPRRIFLPTPTFQTMRDSPKNLQSIQESQ